MVNVQLKAAETRWQQDELCLPLLSSQLHSGPLAVLQSSARTEMPDFSLYITIHNKGLHSLNCSSL